MGFEQSKEDARQVDKRLLALKTAIMERLMHSSRVRYIYLLNCLLKALLSQRGRVTQVCLQPNLPALAWPRVIKQVIRWRLGSPASLDAGMYSLREPAPELMQKYLRCLIAQQCFPTIHEYTYPPECWNMETFKWLNPKAYQTHQLRPEILKANFA